MCELILCDILKCDAFFIKQILKKVVIVKKIVNKIKGQYFVNIKLTIFWYNDKLATNFIN